MKKTIIKSLFWVLFAAWIGLLYIVLMRNEPAVMVKKSVTQYEKKVLEEPNITVYETNAVRYQFSDIGGKLVSAQLKNYKKNQSGGEYEMQSNALELVSDEIDPNARWEVSENSEGLMMVLRTKRFVYKKHFVFNDDYGLKMEVEVINITPEEVRVSPMIVMTKSTPKQDQNFVFSGVTTCCERKVDNWNSSGVVSSSVPCWGAFNEKYWLTLCNSQSFRLIKYTHGLVDRVEFQVQELKLGPDEGKIFECEVYIGPKTVDNLKNFEKKYSVFGTLNSFDYGWFFFLTKPFHYVMDFLVKFLGSAGLAILFITLLLKLLTWQLTSSGHFASIRMRKIEPEIAALRERYKDDSVQMNKELFELYKTHRVNPMASCLISVLQMVLLFPLYKVLSFSIDMRLASFPFWITDLSMKDPFSVFNLFGMLPWQVNDYFVIGAWPILMGLSMFVQQSFFAVDISPEQKFMHYSMPILFTWMMAGLPVGVVIYWTLTNIFTVLQLWYVDRRRKPGCGGCCG